MTIKISKNITDYIANAGVKLVFRTDIRYDRNGLHHTGWDAVTKSGVWGIYSGGELLN